MNQVMGRRFTEDNVRQGLNNVGSVLLPRDRGCLEDAIRGILQGSTREKPMPWHKIFNKVDGMIPKLSEAKGTQESMFSYNCHKYGRGLVVDYMLMMLEDQGLLGTVWPETDYPGQRLSHYLMQPTSPQIKNFLIL